MDVRPDLVYEQDVTINYSQAFWSQVVDERQLTCINELHLKEGEGVFKLLASFNSCFPAVSPF